MQPHVPQDQSVQVADLPLTSRPSETNVPPLATQTSAIPGAVSSSGSLQQMAEQVEQLTVQYGQDPFKLSNALSELRAKYLAEQYHIVPSSVEG